MGHWKKPFKSDHLASCDIEGKDLILTIREVKQEMCKLATGDALCNVAYFKESGWKPMILNVTNSKMVMGFSGGGRDTDTWRNIPVAIYADPKVRFGKDTVEGLRIRPIQPKTAETPKAKFTPESTGWLPAIKWVQDGGDITEIWKKYDVSDSDKLKFKEGLEVKND